MIDHSQAKAQAKEQLRGDFLPLCFISFIPTLTTALLNLVLPGIGTVASYIAMPILTLGVSLVFLNRANGQAYTMAQVITYYPLWGKAFKTFLFVSVQVFLWSILLIVPGVIEAMRCSMTFYILAENPDLSENEAIALSKEMTRGKLWDLFVFEFSFIGWYLLTIVTSGIAALWVVPYHTAAFTTVYLSLKQGYRSSYQARY